MIAETELIQACKENNEYAQRMLYKKYASLLKGICMRYERDHDAVQDLLQDSFIKIFKNIPLFEGNGSFEGWLKRITVNCCIDSINKKKKNNESLFADNEEFENIIEDSDQDETSIIAQIIAAGFTKEKLIDLLHTLPTNYSAVFNLYFIDDQSHQHIATSLSITESLSRKWLYRAKELIKKQLINSLPASKLEYR